MLFSTSLTEATTRIRALAATCSYDYRHFHPDHAEWPEFFHDGEGFRQGYAAFKYAVASVLQPRRIVEIGVGLGVGARAFLEACPSAQYIGYDNEQDVPGSIEKAKNTLALFNADIIKISDSRELTTLPECDLVHVDGCHLYDWAYHDTLLALCAAPWVLVDDSRDSQVAAGAMMAAFTWRPGDLEWTHFEDTWTGNILFCRTPR